MGTRSRGRDSREAASRRRGTQSTFSLSCFYGWLPNFSRSKQAFFILSVGFFPGGTWRGWRRSGRRAQGGDMEGHLPCIYEACVSSLARGGRPSAAPRPFGAPPSAGRPVPACLARTVAGAPRAQNFIATEQGGVTSTGGPCAEAVRRAGRRIKKREN